MNKKLLSLLSLPLLLSLHACVPPHQWQSMEGTYYVTLLTVDPGINAPFIPATSYLKLDINDDNTLTGQFSLGGYTDTGTWRDLLRIDQWYLNEQRTTITIQYDNGNEVDYSIIEYGKIIEFEFDTYGRIIWEK
jgi:hypothetical protein